MVGSRKTYVCGKRQKFSHIVGMSSCEKDGHRIIKFNVHHYLIY